MLRNSRIGHRPSAVIYLLAFLSMVTAFTAQAGRAAGQCLGLNADTNCDGALDQDDVGPFALALLDANAYRSAFPLCERLQADTNADGAVDGRDVAQFVDALINFVPPPARIQYLTQQRVLEGEVQASDIGSNMTVTDSVAAPDFELFLDGLNLEVDSESSIAYSDLLQRSTLCPASMDVFGELALTILVANNPFDGAGASTGSNVFSTTFRLFNDELVLIRGDLIALGADTTASLTLSDLSGPLISITAEQSVEPVDVTPFLTAGLYTIDATLAGEAAENTPSGFAGRSAVFDLEIKLLGTPSPEDLGACCRPNGACIVTTVDGCDGLFQGGGTNCDDAPCPEVGACCLDAGGCELRIAALCVEGEFAGIGTTCGACNALPPPVADLVIWSPPTADNCEPPFNTLASVSISGSGFVDGSAVVMRQAGEPDVVGQLAFGDATFLFADFELAGVTPGLWQAVVVNPDGQESAPSEDVINVTLCMRGACCLGGFCEEQVIGTDCANLGGTFGGVGSTCGDIVCP